MKLTYKLLFLFSSLILFSQNLFAQTYLALDKPGIVKRMRFYIGDEINFKQYGDKKFTTAIIDEIRIPFLILDNTLAVHVDSISHFRADANTGFTKFRRLLSGVLITSGLGYFAIDVFNNSINSSKIFDQNTLTVSAILVGTGLLIKPWKKRVHTIKNNKRLFIIDMDTRVIEE